MKTLVDATFFGVFAPNGELDAVEGTELMASYSASALSPNKNRPNRVVEPVTVIRGDLGAAMVVMLALVTKAQAEGRLNAYETALRAATTIDKNGNPIVVANNALLDAKEKLRTALSLHEAVAL